MEKEQLTSDSHIIFLMHRHRENLCRTLEFLASTGKQSLYKTAMPFIHVPKELLAQWNEDFVMEEDSFRKLFSERQWRALSKFDFQLKTLMMKLPFHLPDVPKIFSCKPWREIECKARESLQVLRLED